MLIHLQSHVSSAAAKAVDAGVVDVDVVAVVHHAMTVTAILALGT